MTPVARTPSPARTCWTRDRGSSRTALPHLLSPGVFGRRQGCDPASDALCRDQRRPARFPALVERKPPDPPPPPPRQRLRFHRTRAPSIGGDPLHLVFFARPACARLLPRGFGGCPPTSAIECDLRARPRTDRTPTLLLGSIGWRLPLRDTPAEGPRIRGPARGSHRAGRRHRIRA